MALKRQAPVDTAVDAGLVEAAVELAAGKVAEAAGQTSTCASCEV